MSHPNRLYNGDISRDLQQWTISGNAAYVANEGNRELGACSLPDAGSSIAQPFSIGVGREYTIELAVKGAADGAVTLTIHNEDSVEVWTKAVDVKSGWEVAVARVGLPWGNYTFTIAYSDVAVHVDDVSIAWVIKSRAELARIVHERLGIMATKAGVALLPTGSGAGGWYEAPIDAGLRAVGATDRAGRPDVRYLDTNSVDAAVDQIELEALHKLHRYWSTRTDFSLGPRSESLSQIGAAIDRLIGTAVGGRSAAAGRGVKQRKLHHRSTRR